MQPTVVLYVGRAREWYFYGPGAHPVTGTLIFDFAGFDSVRFSCPDLGITKSTTVTAQAESATAGADLLVHFLTADTAGQTVKTYDAELVGIIGTEEYVIWQGLLDLRAAVE